MKWICIAIMMIALAAGIGAEVQGRTELSLWSAIIFLMGAIGALECRIVRLERALEDL